MRVEVRRNLYVAQFLHDHWYDLHGDFGVGDVRATNAPIESSSDCQEVLVGYQLSMASGLHLRCHEMVLFAHRLYSSFLLPVLRYIILNIFQVKLKVTFKLVFGLTVNTTALL